MPRLFLFLDALRKGHKLADSALWKKRAAATIALTAFLSGCAKIARSYGYEVPLSDEDVAYIAGAVVVAVSLYFNYATSDTVGVLPDKSNNGDGVSPPPAPPSVGPNDMQAP